MVLPLNCQLLFYLFRGFYSLPYRLQNHLIFDIGFVDNIDLIVSSIHPKKKRSASMPLHPAAEPSKLQLRTGYTALADGEWMD